MNMRESSKTFPSLAEAAAAMREGAFGGAGKAGAPSATEHSGVAAAVAAAARGADAAAKACAASEREDASASFGSFAQALAASKAAGPKLAGKHVEGSRALVLCSGGVDSTTLLAMAVERYGSENVFALSISYGQRHEKEIESAKAVAAYYGVEQRFLDLSAIFADSNCSLLSHSTEEVPEESYAEQLEESEGAPVSTYVPFRNGLFLSSAASMALSLGASVLYYGAHHDDWAGNAYPDCSIEFVNAMNLAIVEGTGGELRMEAPFVQWSKADIVKRGLELGVPYELTWSCYEGGDYPCGTCGTCIDRNRAFELNGVRDPLLEALDAERAPAGE